MQLFNYYNTLIVIILQRKRYADDLTSINLTEFDPDRPPVNTAGKPPKDTVSEIEAVLRGLYMDHGRHVHIISIRKHRCSAIEEGFSFNIVPGLV